MRYAHLAPEVAREAVCLLDVRATVAKRWQEPRQIDLGNRQNGGGGGSRTRRNDSAKPLETIVSDETAASLGSRSASTSPASVARACYALALAVLEGDEERARMLARVVMADALAKAAALS